ncbi:preprotein translocase subunit SecE [Dokdonella fugitiva]|jgi:preprotein translocase subunit SecE|uniref:Protein translocase subunit SecE n=1 Tax=Dokdonella fugitiva TaxID=328517 RepID=A0A839F2S7_9GAMM|nr:preprotein translocase subunit SecE [Dokdonella fugitiva]MBA8888149.1 preprotein translocase subunit SecE [Dokdonella fugitiva]
MNAKVEKAGASNALDVVKLVLAGALLVAGLVAYYYFADWNGWARLGMLVVGVIAAAAVGAFTGVGRTVREYITESQFELRKVVWPTMDETLRTTLVIVVVVIILSLLLGLIDLMLKWAVLDHLLKLGR